MEWDGTEPEIFAPLTADEMRKIYKFLIENNYVYKRNENEDVSLKTNYLPYMYLNLPNKEAVLKYLDKTGPYPGRYSFYTIKHKANYSS